MLNNIENCFEYMQLINGMFLNLFQICYRCQSDCKISVWDIVYTIKTSDPV